MSEYEMLGFSYTLERWMYGISFCVGLAAFIYTVTKLVLTARKDLVLAARLVSYKITLTVADSIVLFVYAPTQFFWIHYFWWYGGDLGCRVFKFVSTFGFHLTANMQVLIAIDRLLITAKLNQVHRNVKKQQYNTRISLAIAWILAFSCACPQLVLFRQLHTDMGHPQCISIWMQQRESFYNRKLELYGYEEYLDLVANKSSRVFYPNGTLSIIFDKPSFTLNELNTEKNKWLFLEQLYNVVHLTTICVLPYSIILVCYALMLYILKGVSKGKFMSLKDVFQTCSFFCCKQRGTPPNESAASQETQSLVIVSPRAPQESIVCVENRERSASFDVARLYDARSAEQDVAISYESGGGQRQQVQRSWWMTVCSFCLPTALFTPLQTGRECTTVEMVSPHLQQDVHRQSTARAVWVSTVDNARRKARWKAFVMLSMNLLFWGPYCILGIIASVAEFDGQSFQFVSALVTFNAISNIML